MSIDNDSKSLCYKVKEIIIIIKIKISEEISIVLFYHEYWNIYKNNVSDEIKTWIKNKRYDVIGRLTNRTITQFGIKNSLTKL